jgi:hypothetical protein
VAADSLENRKQPRPHETALLDWSEWFRCPACGTPFGAASGLRAHRRFNRCRVADPLDRPEIPEPELRRLVREGLRELTLQGGRK